MNAIVDISLIASGSIYGKPIPRTFSAVKPAVLLITKFFISTSSGIFTNLKKNYFYNQFHNILGFFDLLPNLSFTTSETTADFYLQK